MFVRLWAFDEKSHVAIQRERADWRIITTRGETQLRIDRVYDQSPSTITQIDRARL